MKRNFLLLFTLLSVIACNRNDNLSDAYGNFEVDEKIISAEANGQLILFNIEEGGKVFQNQMVGIIDTTHLHLQRQQLKAQMRSVSSQIANIEAQIKVQEQKKKNLKRDKKRVEQLLEDNAATQKQLDDINGEIDLVNTQIASIETQYTSVKSELSVLRTKIAQVDESIRNHLIINPQEGIVLEKYAEQDEITSFGRPLYKLADMNEMILRVYISGAQLPDVRTGQEVEVLVDKDKKSNRRLTGTIIWISETAEFTPKIIQTKEERVNMVYAVKVKVINNGSLKTGMPGEVNL